MTPTMTKKLKYYLRLQYPVRVVLSAEGLVGEHPDLPGCQVTCDSTSALYAALDDARRHWLREQVVMGNDIPLPNSYLAVEEPEARPHPPERYLAREATPY